MRRSRGHCLRIRGLFGDTAALEAHGDQKFISAREDRLPSLVLRFLERRIAAIERRIKAQEQALSR